MNNPKDKIATELDERAKELWEKPKEKVIKFKIEGIDAIEIGIPIFTIISKILPDLENEVKEFKAKIKKLKDTGSPIQIVDTSKNFLILLKDKYEKTTKQN